MNDPLVLVAQHGVALVFANVLIEQAGLPVPAVPTLILAGALAAEGKISAAAVLGVAVAACMIADGLWYLSGRRYGLGVLKLLCKVSLSPDSCVRQTQNRYGHWGSFALVFGKFIPGMSTVAPPLAGAMRVGWARFMFFDALGSLVWAGTAIGVGMVFHHQIGAIVAGLEDLGAVAIQIVAALLAVFIALKWWQRRRFLRTLRLSRISVAELRELMEAGRQPVVVDVRAAPDREIDGRYIPGALAMDLADIDGRRSELPAEREVIFYCTCPNEASAASAAKQLMELGYTRVRPLLGGLDEWVAAGYEVERRAG